MGRLKVVKSDLDTIKIGNEVLEDQMSSLEDRLVCIEDSIETIKHQLEIVLVKLKDF